MSRPTGVSKTTNEYADALGKFYSDTPKAVFAALAYSLCGLDVEGTGGDGTDEAIRAALLEEWAILYENGIVPQKPPKS